MARALSRVPAETTAAHRHELFAQFSPADAEWMVLGVAMMGFLNKFMDALGVELEGATVEEVSALLTPSGWAPGQHTDGGARPDGREAPRADGVMTKLGVLRHAPGALALDTQWTKGVPSRWPAAGAFLRERTGHDFPILSHLRHARAIRALTTMLRDNLDPKESAVGVPRKIAAGIVFAKTVGNAALEEELGKLGPVEEDASVEALARAVSPSPAEVDDAVIERCRALPPAAIVEVVTFISVMQLVHRLETFYAAV